MKPINRAVLVITIAFVVVVTALSAGWLTADVAAPQQEPAEAEESTSEEPLPEFQPTERLPTDSAVAFPTDI